MTPLESLRRLLAAIDALASWRNGGYCAEYQQVVDECFAAKAAAREAAK